jgi:hypothetical protein
MDGIPMEAERVKCSELEILSYFRQFGQPLRGVPAKSVNNVDESGFQGELTLGWDSVGDSSSTEGLIVTTDPDRADKVRTWAFSKKVNERIPH